MKNILVLGHRGMLGNAVVKYFSTQNGYVVNTIETRWGNPLFEEELTQSDAEFIINAIGAIPQKKLESEEYTNLNIHLPVFLETLGKKILHPTTDCEFSGNIPEQKKYSKNETRDAEDAYGISKAGVAALIEKDFKNTKMIRTSIIGHELHSNVSLLDWFLASQGEVNGYTNHFWNGITTLEWAHLAERIIENWEEFPILNQYGTGEVASKYEVLTIAKEVYGKEVMITPFEASTSVNKCLESDMKLPTLREQLQELKAFYNR